MKVTELQNVVLGITRIPAGGPSGKDWRLTLQDADTREVIWVDFNKEVADNIVKKLTQGIQIATELPKL